jgi:DNA-binding transcriptional LysR family regulator
VPPQIELRHLRYFTAVAEELSFTKAAEKLRLAQPSLTRQVRNLELEIGVRLLDRTTKGVALTAEGRLFLFDCRKLLAQCGESIAAVQRMSQGECSLDIGYIANTQNELLPASLEAFRKLSPRVAMNLFDMTSAEQFQALENRKLDLGFIGIRPVLSGHQFHSECVAQDTILLAVAKGHPLARKSKITLGDLAGQFFIGMSRKTEPGAREGLHQPCASAGFDAKVLQEADAKPTAIKFVAAGLGVALMPQQTTSLPHEGVCFRPLCPPLHRESRIAWRADNSSKPLKDYLRVVKELSGSLTETPATQTAPARETAPRPSATTR